MSKVKLTHLFPFIPLPASFLFTLSGTALREAGFSVDVDLNSLHLGLTPTLHFCFLSCDPTTVRRLALETESLAGYNSYTGGDGGMKRAETC